MAFTNTLAGVMMSGGGGGRLLVFWEGIKRGNGMGGREMGWDFMTRHNFSIEVFKDSISCLLLFVCFFKVSMVLSLSWIPFFKSWVW